MPTKDDIRELLSLSVFDLDDHVHDIKGKEAAQINNNGKVAQVAYIMGIGEAEVEAVVREFSIELYESEDKQSED